MNIFKRNVILQNAIFLTNEIKIPYNKEKISMFIVGNRKGKLNFNYHE